LAIENKPIAGIIEAAGKHKLLGSPQNGRWKVGSITIKSGDGSELYLEPILNEVRDGQGNAVIQAIFRDATEEQGRQAGLRAFSAHVIRAQEEERQRIARELHDETIQSLVLLCRRLDTLQNASNSLSPSLVDNLQEVRRNAEGIVAELRDFTKTLRPPILDDLGIATSIRRLLADFVERTRIKGQLKMIGEERRLPSETELGMFRIAQEALRNIERHAQATHVAVTLTFAKEEARLEMLDNGVGFSKALVLSDFTASGHMGLISMRERAQLFGGKLEIRSILGKGTRITLFVPSADDIPKPQAT
ncbi:MAG: sensor histidine kinase, partial [Chloroflexi bacterium]|nr:sensor histidine kinase [Chloroflexota bacterium]